MRREDVGFLLRTLGFAALSGMRSLSPPALLSLYLSRQHARGDAAQLLESPRARAAVIAMALGEMTADKFPNAPNRTFPPAVVFRALTGGGGTALLWSMNKRPAWVGGLLGAALAIANTYPTFSLRMWLGRVLPIPNAISWAGVLEDAVVWLGGWWLLQGTADNKRVPAEAVATREQI